MDAASKIPEHLRGAFVEHLEELQIRGNLATYTRIGEACFRDCVTQFRSKALEEEEERCIRNCASVFLKMSNRVAERFNEIQVQEQQAAVLGSQAK
jgi:import inner membrane translocase subunit TIM9